MVTRFEFIPAEIKTQKISLTKHDYRRNEIRLSMICYGQMSIKLTAILDLFFHFITINLIIYPLAIEMGLSS